MTMNEFTVNKITCAAPTNDSIRADQIQAGNIFVTSLSERVNRFLCEAFPEDPNVRPKVRVYRFLEEALELAQAMGITEQEVYTQVGYTFSRPVGEPLQELGGVVFTLQSVANALGSPDLNAVGHASVDEGYSRIDAIRAKSHTKPKVSE